MAPEETPQVSSHVAPDVTLPEIVAAALSATSSHSHRTQAFVPPTNGVRVHDRTYSAADIPSQSPNYRSVPVGHSPTRSRGTPMGSPQDTPSTRTGPPRSLSYQFTPTYTPSISQLAQFSTEPESSDIYEHTACEDPSHMDPHRFTSFRGALELQSTSSDRGTPDRKGKKRESSRTMDDSWNPIRWFHEHSAEEKGKEKEKPASITEEETKQKGSSPEEDLASHPQASSKEDSTLTALQRAHTHPAHNEPKRFAGSVGWSKLRTLLPSIIRHAPSAAASHSVLAPEVNITDELITGGLSTMMLGLWFERDDKAHRRIPILLHRLRIRISDSLHPTHSQKAVFRIECEYANGAIRWVVYRQLRDFISLHTHYAISNAFRINKDALPEFPRTSS